MYVAAAAAVGVLIILLLELELLFCKCSDVEAEHAAVTRNDVHIVHATPADAVAARTVFRLFWCC